MPQQSLTFQSTITKQVALKYLLWIPPAYDSAKKFPLIFFLHGIGERGDDLEKLKKEGLPALLENPPAFLNSFVVVSPQCPAESDWYLEMDALIALLDHVVTQYSIDRIRVYLTGLSMGGRGTWHLAALRPDFFAALVPICGARPEILRRVERRALVKKIPTWVFHGEQDAVVPVSESINLFNDLKENNPNIQLTIYPDVQHDSWTRTYANPKLYEWMLAQKRKNYGTP